MRMPAQPATWQDVLQMPEDGNRYEAIGGVLYVSPAPTLRHQWISGNLEEVLRRLLMNSGLGYVFHAPVGVEFPITDEGVQPDIIFVSKSRADRMVKEGIRGAPDLVIEILSPSTAQRDRTIKRDLYERQGVPAYWLVDPETETVEVWNFAVAGMAPQSYSDVLPVMIGHLNAGGISLPEIFKTEI